MGKVLFWICLLLAGYYMYSNGTLMALLNGNVPQSGRIAEACGPKGGSAYLALYKEDAGLPIDCTIGYSTRDRLPAVAQLAGAIHSGRVLRLKDNTKIKVLGTDKINLYRCMYKVVRVKVLEGAYKDKSGWMIRDDVIDTPLQVLVHEYFRSGKNKISSELSAYDPNKTYSKFDEY